MENPVIFSLIPCKQGENTSVSMPFAIPYVLPFTTEGHYVSELLFSLNMAEQAVIRNTGHLCPHTTGAHAPFS